MVSQAASGLMAAKFPIGPTKIQLCQLRNQVPMNARQQQRVPIKCSVTEVFRDFSQRAVDFLNSRIRITFCAKLTGFPMKTFFGLVEGFPWKKMESVPFLHWLLVLVKEGLRCYLLARIAFHVLSGYSYRCFGTKEFLIPFSIFVGNLLSTMVSFRFVKQEDGPESPDTWRPLSESCFFSFEAGVGVGKIE